MLGLVPYTSGSRSDVSCIHVRAEDAEECTFKVLQSKRKPEHVVLQGSTVRARASDRPAALPAADPKSRDSLCDA